MLLQHCQGIDAPFQMCVCCSSWNGGAWHMATLAYRQVLWKRTDCIHQLMAKHATAYWNCRAHDVISLSGFQGRLCIVMMSCVCTIISSFNQGWSLHAQPSLYSRRTVRCHTTHVQIFVALPPCDVLFDQILRAWLGHCCLTSMTMCFWLHSRCSCLCLA